MDQQDKRSFVRLMAQMGECYQHPINTMLTEIYWGDLRGFPLAAVQRAFTTHRRSPDRGRYMPRISDVVYFIEGDTKTRALKAWTKVQKAMRFVGCYQSIVFDDALIHLVVDDLGGWVSLCRLPHTELPFTERRFVERYLAYWYQPPGRYPRILKGLLSDSREGEGKQNGQNKENKQKRRLSDDSHLVKVGSSRLAEVVLRGEGLIERRRYHEMRTELASIQVKRTVNAGPPRKNNLAPPVEEAS